MFLGSLVGDVVVAITIIVLLCTDFLLDELSGFFGMILATFVLRESLVVSLLFLPSYSLKSLPHLPFTPLSPSEVLISFLFGAICHWFTGCFA